MKSLNILAISFLALGLTACNDFIDVPPTGVLDSEHAYQQPDKLVNAAYASLGDCWYSYPFNLWPYGDLGSDDCMKGGGGTTDTGYHPMEIWSTLTSTPGELDELWYRLYCNISRCNRALIALEENGVEVLGEETAAQRVGEVHFLRGHNYFKLVTMFRQVPWIDEEVLQNNSQEKTPNNEYSYEELFGKVIHEFELAYNALPDVTEDGGGRANRIAAAAYLAKCYLTLAWGDGYEKTDGVNFINQEYMKKVEQYTKVVKDSRFGYLEDFGDIFLPEYKNSKESVFAVQTSQYDQDNTKYGRANWSIMLNGCWGMWSCGWDFHKPSRTPATYGFYTSLKEVPQRSAGETFDGSWQAFATNDYVFRYTDVMLMRAEALIELDRLEEAREIINDIRQRAANSIDKHIQYAKDFCEIALYPASDFSSKEKARTRLRWERRLEMAMESSRYFDLRRWGIASSVLNSYFEKAAKSEYENVKYGQYYKDAHYTPGKNEFYPIPYNQLYYVPGLYVQNQGYN